jgi:hypothetical protein
MFPVSIQNIEQGLTILDFRSYHNLDRADTSKIVNRCSLFLN